MSKVNLAITGCMGRMGQQLIKSSKDDKNIKLTTLTENRLIKKKISGIKVTGKGIDCGHYLQEEKPENVLSALKNFL